MLIEKGFCQCGCGQKTTITKYNRTRDRYVKGQPKRFIRGHQNRGLMHPNWKGGKPLSQGYVFILKPDHRKANCQGYVAEHTLIAEEALGKPLPARAIVHHANENRSDNRKENLVICQDRVYHLFLHQRMRALKACGHANWRKCKFCKEYDDPENLYITKQNGSYHNKCVNEYQKQLRIRKKQEARDESNHRYC